jgi:hypothetical protein
MHVSKQSEDLRYGSIEYALIVCRGCGAAAFTPRTPGSLDGTSQFERTKFAGYADEVLLDQRFQAPQAL